MRTYLFIGVLAVAALLILAGCTQTPPQTGGDSSLERAGQNAAQADQSSLSVVDRTDPAANISTPSASTIPDDFAEPA